MRGRVLRGRRTLGIGLALAALGVWGCSNDEPFGPLPPGLAQVTVTAYYDLDGNPGRGGGDTPAPGLRLQVVLPGSETAVASGTADGEGQIALVDIPVGTYQLRIDPTYLGDTLVVAQIDTARLTLQPGDVVSVEVGVTSPTVSVAQARDLGAGRRVWLEGLALNRRFSSIDGALHVLESTGSAMRVVLPAAGPGAAGDSVRVLGVTAGTGARRFLAEGFVSIVASDVRAVVPRSVTVDEARTAGGGALDALLLVISSGTVSDAIDIPFVGTQVTVTDGADEVTVTLLSQNGFGVPPEVGSEVEAVAGVLVPVAGSSDWQIVPRGPGDVSFLSPPDPVGLLR